MTSRKNENPVWHILLVEDDEDDYLLAKDMLREARGQKVEVDWAPTYNTGQRALSQKHYDAVLVDYDLGELTGIDFIKETIERDYPGPLILYTGRGSYDVDIEAMQAGATVYLSKGESNALLLERSIRYAIERKQIEIQLRDANTQLEYELAERERAEQIQQVSEAKYQRLFECIPVPAAVFKLVYDEHGKIVDLRVHAANPPWLRNMGFQSAEDVVGKLCVELFGRAAMEEPISEYRKVVASGVVRTGQLAFGWNRHEYLISRFPLEKDFVVSTSIDITEIRRTQKQVEDERTRLRAILDTIPVGIGILDEQGRLVESNDLAARVWGTGSKEELPVDPGEYKGLPQADAEIGLKEYVATKVLQGGSFIDLEFEIERFDGTKGYVLSSAAPIKDSSGRLIGAVATGVDITERKQIERKLQESEEKARDLIRYAASGIYEMDLAQGHFRNVNDAMCQLLEYTREELLAMDPLELLVGPSKALFLERVRRALAGEKISETVEYKVRSKTGQEHDVVLNTTISYRDEKPDSAMVIAHDITKHKQSEEEIQRYAAELARSNKALEDFAVIASHDLQEPLRKIQSFSLQLHKTARSNLSEKELDFLERMQSAAHRMQRMIDDLLAYSRVMTQPRSKEQVDLAEVAAEVISDLDFRVQETSGRVQLGLLPVVEADRMQMYQLLQNLIANALKFHREDTPPVVQVSSLEARPGFIDLLIEDNGIGFDMRQAGKIFQPFQRLHALSQFGGTGIGLAICHKIAEVHGGEITVESTPGQGSTFTVRLPVKQTASTPLKGERWG